MYLEPSSKHGGTERELGHERSRVLPMWIRHLGWMRTIIFRDRRRSVYQETVVLFPYKKVSAQEMSDLRNIRILRSQGVWVDQCEDKRAMADVGRRDIVGRRKGSSYTHRQCELVNISGRSYTICRECHPQLDSDGRKRACLRERHAKQSLRMEGDVEILWNLRGFVS